MATNLQALAFEKAEIISSRLKEIISSGQGYIQNQLGLDLGLDPDVYSTWVLFTAAAGLLVALVLCWVAICGGASVGKTRGSPLTEVQGEKPLKANVDNSAKTDEQKKKNKKKSTEKKAQSNGRQFSGPQEDPTSNVTSQQPPAETLPVKVEQAPAQVKKNKKKAKVVVGHVVSIFTSEEKEPDEGAWQTQVSQREKRQQRRKDKAPEDTGSPGGPKAAPRTHVETPATSTNRSRGPQGGRKGDTSTNGGGASGGGGTGGGGGGRADACFQPPGQPSGGVEREKWSSRAQRQRAQPEPKLWGQDKQATRSVVEGRTNTGFKPTSQQGLKPAEHASLPVALQWDIHPDDEWCGLNGATAGDAGSDWSAPLVHWGHYEGPASSGVDKGPSSKEQPQKVSSGGEKMAEGSVGGTKSTKKRRKKNRTAEEDGAAVTQVGGTIGKAAEAPAVSTNKHSGKRPDSEKKSEQRAEPLRPGQKKRA